jgi:type IV secretory pathway VirB2 component (pilin)
MNNNLFGAVANIAAAVGVVACAATGLNRLLGGHHFLGYEAMTVFTGGVALMVFAALIKLQIIDSKLSGK